MTSTRDICLLNKHIITNTSYEKVKDKLEFSNLFENVIPRERKINKKILIPVISFASSALIVVSILLLVNSFNSKNGSADVWKTIDYTLVSAERYNLDLLGIDISPEYQESDGKITKSNDVGRLVNNQTELNELIDYCSLNQSSDLHNQLKAYDDQFYADCSLAIMFVYEEEQKSMDFLNLGDFVYDKENEKFTKSQLSALWQIEVDETKQHPTIKTAIASIKKADINNLEYTLTTNEMCFFTTYSHSGNA